VQIVIAWQESAEASCNNIIQLCNNIIQLCNNIIQPEANAAAVQADTTADANLARQLHQQELYELHQRSRPKRE